MRKIITIFFIGLFINEGLQAQTPIQWTNAVGVSVSGNKITKTAGNSYSNGGASSVQSIPANTEGWVEYSVSANTNFMIGFSDEDQSQHYNTIDFSFFVQFNNLYLLENGSHVGVPQKVASIPNITSAKFRLVRKANGTVEYWFNGTKIQDSPKTYTGTLIADVTIYGTGAFVTGTINTNSSSGGSPSPWTSGSGNIHYTGGNVGIGTSNPSETLHVNGDLRVGSNGTINSSGDELRLMYQVRNNDNSYEWVGFYSGTTRQGIILYDGSWSGANSLTNEFSITAENSNKLTLNTNNGDVALMPKNGDVGIGNLNPTEKLDVNGKVKATHFIGDGSLLTNLPTTEGQWTTSSSNIYFTGDVGIGTDVIDSKLTVKGKIHAQEVRVDLNGAIAPDYVFEEDYDLPALESIESYIKENKHLPEIPSAQQMEEGGVNLKEMNLLLLKKIEEMTLYQIDFHHDLKEQRKQINLMKKKIEKALK
ncbi:MAG: tail fiber protein [Bacteroidota bacterium]